MTRGLRCQYREQCGGAELAWGSRGGGESGERSGESAHSPGPTLSGSSSCSAGRGWDIAATSTSRPLGAAQPGDRRRSHSMRCARDWRPGDVGGDSSGSARLPHLLPSPLLRLSPGSSSPPSHRPGRRGAAPSPPPPDKPIRPGTAPHVTSQAPPSAPRPKFGEGPALPLSSRPRPGPIRDPLGPQAHTWKAKG